MRKYVEPGDLLPKWYGIAWFDPCRQRGVSYPIPLNIAARWAHLVYLWFKNPMPLFGNVREQLERAESERTLLFNTLHAIRGKVRRGEPVTLEDCTPTAWSEAKGSAGKEGRG